MKTKIENQEQYEALIKQFKEKYIQELKTKLGVPDCDKAYVKERYKRDVLEVRLNEIINSRTINEVHHFRNQMKWQKGINTFEAIKAFCEEKKLIRILKRFYKPLLNTMPF